MASKKKESEGIALLSMYNDEDEDIEDMDEDERENTDAVEDFRASERVTSDVAQETSPSLIEAEISLSGKDLIPQVDRVPTPTPQAHNLLSTQPSSKSQRPRKGTLAIVDYAHDETAMSPEAEEGEILAAGRVMFGAELQTANGILQERTPPGTVQILTPGVQATPPKPSEQPEPSQSDNSMSVNYGTMELEDVNIEETVAVSVEAQGDADALDKFLPPPPKIKCSEDLQEKINRFLALKRAGKSFNAEVRNRKDYRNPDFLQHAVTYQNIDQIGSCFSKDVFDPHGYDKSDYYDEIEADMKREMERKEQEKKKSQKMEFVAGGTQPGMVSMAPKISMQVPGALTVASSGLHSLSTAGDAVARDSRINKKSKWDKVDGDRRNPLHSGGQDTVSTAGTHASLLSAANAGAGYSAFAITVTHALRKYSSTPSALLDADVSSTLE
ncbi:HCNGP-like [Macleaya cordata]|uniref:HCNGP-like n=1 Tax=Macleaya cordata TaxID=56857 RepID=A0A200PPG6_MACCD|nr:HCNGP-like [Macleaya cordata]